MTTIRGKRVIGGLFILSVVLSLIVSVLTGFDLTVHATDKNEKATEAVTMSEAGDELLSIPDDALVGQDLEAGIVQGADGLWYVVVGDDAAATVGDVDLESPLKAALSDPDSSSFEVGIDPKRQEDADTADRDVETPEDVDMTDIVDIQSALNNEDFEFLSDEEVLAGESTTEQQELYEQTQTYYIETLLRTTANYNDIPSDFKMSNQGLMARAAANLVVHKYNPPGTYGWVLYFTTPANLSYTEDQYWRKMFNGREVFCIQPGVNVGVGYSSAVPSSYLDTTESEKIMAIALAYHRDSSNGTKFNLQQSIGAQLAIWDSLRAARQPKGLLITPDWKAAITTYRNGFNTKAANMRKTPTFDKTSSTVDKGTDAKYTIKSNGGDITLGTPTNSGTASISGNVITVKTGSVTASNTEVDVYKGTSLTGITNFPQYVWSSGSYQKIVSGHYRKKVATLTTTVNSKGTVSVKKIDASSKKVLSGAVFEFKYGNTTKSVTTDANGIAQLTDKLAGGTVVTVKETKAPTNYVLDSTSFTITTVAGKDSQTTRSNTLSTGTASVLKVDVDTGKALAGAVFQFSYNGTSKNVTTGANGIANLGVSLTVGTVVTVKEITAPVDYQLDSTSFTITIVGQKDSQVRRNNKIKPGAFKIVKTNNVDGGALPGVTFSVYYSNGTLYKSGLVTNASGVIGVDNVPPGNYYAVETATLPGFALDSGARHFTVKPGTTQANAATVSMTNNMSLSLRKHIGSPNVTTSTWHVKNATTYVLTTQPINKIGSKNLPSLIIKDSYANVASTIKLTTGGVKVFTTVGSTRTDITSLFSISVSGGVVTATATATGLADSRMYGTPIMLETTANVVGPPAKTGAVVQTTSGTLQIGKAPIATSNSVTSTLPLYTLNVNHNLYTDESATKLISKISGNSDKYYRGEDYRYRSLVGGKHLVGPNVYFYWKIGAHADYAGEALANGSFEYKYQTAPFGKVTKTVDKKILTYNDTFTYKVDYNLPKEYSMVGLPANSFTFYDMVPDEVDVTSVSMINETGKDVTSLFDNKTDKAKPNNVVMSAKTTSLRDDSFYGHKYTMVINVKVATKTTNVPNDLRKDITILNSAYVDIWDVKLMSDPVTSVIPVYDINVNHDLVKKPFDLNKLDLIVRLAKSSQKFYRGQVYEYKAMPRGRVTHEGKSLAYYFEPKGGPDVVKEPAMAHRTINFYYLPVSYTVALQEVSILTDKFSEGLTFNVKTRVTPVSRDTDYTPDLAAKIRMDLTAVGTNKVVYSKEYTLSALGVTDGVTFDADVKAFMTKDTKDKFTVNLVNLDDKAYELTGFNSGKEMLSLDGYTASEKHVKANAAMQNKLTYTGVVKTLVKREKPLDTVITNEVFNIALTDIGKIKTGYSNEVKYNVTYTNPLSNSWDTLGASKSRLFVENALVDETMVLPKVGSKKYYAMENLNAAKTGSESRMTIAMPKVFVEKGSGDSYLTNTGRDSSQPALLDGGRRLYIPIWLKDLAVYTPSLESVETIGVNRITYEVANPMNVYAYMYATMGSSTLGDDELLVQPVFPESLEKPEGWTDAQFQRLKEFLK